jgi:CDP-diacylglycerol--glycerol-3-phosphate 3-phosphatidyltransferase
MALTRRIATSYNTRISVQSPNERAEQACQSLVFGGILPSADGSDMTQLKTLANKITIARIVLLPGFCYLLYLEGGVGHMFLILGITLALGLTDWLDGIIARKEGTTVLGSLLDPIADKIFIAVIYLPLTEKGLIPLWMTACIFSRDFLVTSLRTSMLLRRAPMRTSTLAKFKTAIQMFAIGYVILYHFAPYAWFAEPLVAAPIVVPLAVVIYRLIRREPQGKRSLTMLGLFVVGLLMYRILGPALASTVTLWIVTALTVVSGGSYLVDAWSALRGQQGSFKEIGRFVLDGLLVPIVLLLLLGRQDAPGMSAVIIGAFTLELAGNGLANFLASEQIAPRFRWIAAKSALLVVLSGVALYLWWFDIELAWPVAEACVWGVLAVTVIFAIVGFWRHRRTYLRVI